jgi:hypothetical protein
MRCLAFDGRNYYEAQLPPAVVERYKAETRFPEEEWKCISHPPFNANGNYPHREYFVYQHKEQGGFAVHRVGLGHVEEAIFFVPDTGALVNLLCLDVGGYADDQADLELGYRDPRPDETIITREELEDNLAGGLSEGRVGLPVEGGPRELFDQLVNFLDERAQRGPRSGE